MSLDMEDPYEAHALFALEFHCEACGCALNFTSSDAAYSESWYRELALQAKRLRWFVPPVEAEGKMDVMSA